MAKSDDGEPKQPESFIKNSLIELVQAGTGVAVSSKKDLVKDFSHILQQGIRGKLLEGLDEAYTGLKERGKIKPDYIQTDQCRQELPYIFSVLNGDEVIDEKRFEAVKNIFLNAAQERLSDRNSQLPLEMMRIACTLNRGEILVLEAAYSLNQEANALPNREAASKTVQYDNAWSWLALMAEKSGLGIPDLVGVYEKNLIKVGLLSPRTAGGNVVVDTNYHLSGTGLKLSEFIIGEE